MIAPHPFVQDPSPAAPFSEGSARFQRRVRPFSDETVSSRRERPAIRIERDGQGSIRSATIGAWRTITSGLQRRIIDVRQIGENRVAVRLEQLEGGSCVTSDVWQLYGVDGRLEAAMQTSVTGQMALLTNYQTRQACRLVRNSTGKMETVESWEI